MARPEAKIDLAELEKLAGMQCTNEEIAAFFGISSRTIVRRCRTEKFRDIIEQGRAKGRVSVRRALFKLANAGNVAAAIFLSKNLPGYKARPDFSKLSNEGLEILRRLVGKAKPADGN